MANPGCAQCKKYKKGIKYDEFTDKMLLSNLPVVAVKGNKRVREVLKSWRCIA